MPLPIKIAVANYPHTARLIAGALPIAGITPEFVQIKPQIAAYRMMVRTLAFDVCELAPTTYLIARAHGVPIAALPVFLMRRFHHGGLRVSSGSEIFQPKDIEGKRVGVRAWSVTTGVWARAVLGSDYGVDWRNITWVVDDEEHVEAMELPPNVIHAPANTSLAQMMAAGELDAAFDGNAGIGRSGAPLGYWKAEEATDYPELFSDAQSLEADYFRRTGIYPIHGTLVVKQAVLDANPWLAGALCDAFAQSKDDWLAGLRAGDGAGADDRKYRKLMQIVGDDPLPFGVEANRKSIDALIDAAFDQALIPERVSIGDVFVGR